MKITDSPNMGMVNHARRIYSIEYSITLLLIDYHVKMEVEKTHISEGKV